jgi:hypothetical protein
MAKPANEQDNKSPIPTGINNKHEIANEVRDGRTYDRSTKIADPGGATEDNPHPVSPFVKPSPDGLLTPEWEKASR